MGEHNSHMRTAARVANGSGALTVAEVRLTPILIADPPLLNTQGVHQPYTPRLIVEVVTADGTTGIGETYGDTRYLDLAAPLAKALPGREVSDLNGLFTLAEQVCGDPADVSDSVDIGGLRGVQTADKLRLSVISGCRCTRCSAARSATTSTTARTSSTGSTPTPATRASPTTGAPPSTRPGWSPRPAASPAPTASARSSSRAACSRPSRRWPRSVRSPRRFPGSRCGSTPTAPGRWRPR